MCHRHRSPRGQAEQGSGPRSTGEFPLPPPCLEHVWVVPTLLSDKSAFVVEYCEFWRRRRQFWLCSATSRSRVRIVIMAAANITLQHSSFLTHLLYLVFCYPQRKVNFMQYKIDNRYEVCYVYVCEYRNLDK